MDSILAAKQILENYDARVPKDNDRVYKDECLYSFDSPVSKKLLTLIFFIENIFQICAIKIITIIVLGLIIVDT